MKTITLILFILIQSYAYADPGVRQDYSFDLVLKDGSKVHKEIKNVPYVTDGAVTVFPGESFSIGVELDGDKIKRVFYDKEKTSKTGIDFNFKQEDISGGERLMILTVESRLPKTLVYEAFITSIHNRSEETSVLPIEAGLMCQESWPYPIMKIVLRNFKLEEAK